MRTKERLTKKAVVTEVRGLRDKINAYFAMSDEELEREYAAVYPAVYHAGNVTRDEMLKGLIMSATHYLTLVLNVE